MAIDFCVDYQCDAKRQIGTEELLHLYQARLAYQATQRAPTRQGETAFWTRVVRGPHKDRVELVTVGQLRRKSNRLIEFTVECATCPANVTGEPAGCFGRITYPIDSLAERYLAEQAARLVTAPSVAPARAFVQWISDGPVDGARVRRMRDAARRGVRFFELPEPLPVLPPTPDGSQPTITTDQLIELMFFPFVSGRTGFHFSVPHSALGGHRAFLDFVLANLDLGHRRAELERSTTLEELRWYARALAVADDLGVDLLVD
ncbi:MAG: hypothetical protein C4290_06920 [Chloroflexota bacterium]